MAKPERAADAAPQAMPGRALLGEIETLLDALLRTGEGGSIDVRSLPMSPAERSWLVEQLGDGEVVVQLDLNGRSSIRETGLAGVWWIEHRDEQGRLASEFIQVAYVPDLVSAHPDDVEAGLDVLRGRLAGNR